MDSPTLISLNDAAALTSLSRTMLNKYRAAGQFPDAVPMGDRRIAFVRGEVLAWIQERIDRRRCSTVANDNTPAMAKEAAR